MVRGVGDDADYGERQVVAGGDAGGNV